MPTVLLTVGTDHHPFDRMATWFETWRDERATDVRCVHQHGTSRPARGAEAHEMVSPTELLRLMQGASVIVVQGGPGSIDAAHAVGLRPIVVPRVQALGEHVDDHQSAYSRHLASVGDVLLATAYADFAGHLDDALRDPTIVTRSVTQSPSRVTARRLDAVVEEVLTHRTLRLPRRRAS